MPVRRMFHYPEPPRRSPASALLSLVVHGVAAAGAFWLASVQAARAPLPREQVLPFLRVMIPAAPAPVEAVEAVRRPPPRIPAPAPPPALEPLELSMPLAPVAPTPRAALAAPEPVREPALANKPPVRVGEFASSSTTPTAEAERREVRAVGFDAQRAIAPELGTRVTSVGAFGSDSANARPGSDRTNGRVVSSGFESPESNVAPSAPPRAGRVVSSGAFGETTASPSAPAGTREAVKSAGFSYVPPAPATAAHHRMTPTVTPVEVLFKPTPAYSAEARALKIQGEVTLEVQFSAAGQIRVLRVVRGLGHGLDELAISAAEQIRFKPAQSNGRPVDFTATVEIVFRLT